MLLIQNIRVTDPRSSHHGKRLDIRLSESRILEIGLAGTLGASEDTELHDMDGLWVSPGWVDMQTHLSDPGFEYKETLEELGHAARAGGFTSLLCYPNTLPVIDNHQVLAAMAARSQSLPVRFLFAAALSTGAEGHDLAELYDLRQAGAVAFTNGIHPIANAGLLLRTLQYTRPFDGLIIDFPFDPAIAGGYEVYESSGTTKLGMAGIPAIAESIPASRNLQVLEYAGGRLHLQPVTGSETLKMIAAAKERLPGLTIGVPAHYLTMDDSQLDGFDSNSKLMPPLRTADEVESLKKAVKSGLIDVISSGHRAQSPEEKIHEFALAEPGILGLQSCYSLCNEAFADESDDMQDMIVKALAIRPREILRLPPSIVEEGNEVDLTFFDPKLSWRLTRKNLMGRARNSPQIGNTLNGKAKAIYCKGQLLLV